MLLPLCRVLMERLSLIHKCIIYLMRYMTYWTRLSLNGLVTAHIYISNSASRQQYVVWALMSPFLNSIKTLFLIVRLFFKAALAAILCRLSNILHLAYHSLWPLCAMAKAKLAAGLLFRNILPQILVVHLWQRSLTLIFNLRFIMMAWNHLVMHLTFQQIPGKWSSVWKDLVHLQFPFAQSLGFLFWGSAT